MRHGLAVLVVHLRLGVLNELQYRVNFWAQLGNTAVSLAVALASLHLVYSHTDHLGGWSRDQLLGLVGVFFVVSGLLNAVVQPSMASFMEDVRLGDFDFRLLKPADSQLLASVQSVNVWMLTDVVLGGGLIGVSMWHAGAWSAVQLLAPLLLAAGMTILYSFWVLLSTIAFWAVRMGNLLYAMTDMLDSMRWPVTIFPPWLRFTLSFVFPAGFAITVPAQAVAGTVSARGAAGALVFAVALSLVARRAWRYGLRHYSGASA